MVLWYVRLQTLLVKVAQLLESVPVLLGSGSAEGMSVARDSLLLAATLLQVVDGDMGEQVAALSNHYQHQHQNQHHLPQWLTALKSASSALELLREEMPSPSGAPTLRHYQEQPSQPPLPPSSAELKLLLPGLEETSRTTFAQIVGNEVAKAALWQSCVLPLTLSGELRSRFLTGIRSGCGNVLLYGPPGTGKTLLAQATANEAGARFFSIRPSDVLSKFHGESEKAIRAIFSEARAIGGKTVIFFDEIDSIACTRGTSDEGMQSRRLLSELLLQMTLQKQLQSAAAAAAAAGAGGGGGVGGGDGAVNSIRSDFDSEAATPPPTLHSRQQIGPRDNDTDSAEGIVVVAATNRISDLDDAVIRRFESRVLVALPSQSARRQLLLHYLGSLPQTLSEDDLETLAETTHGWSGSDIENWCRDAAMGPLRRFLQRQASGEEEEGEEEDKINIADFKQALQKQLRIEL